MSIPRTPLESLSQRRFLIGGWPWRSLAYVMSSVPIMCTVGVLVMPWLVGLAVAVVRKSPSPGIVVAILVGAVLVVAGAPLVALPLARLERWRLRLVDSRPTQTDHRPPSALGLLCWLRTRYTETSTWREVGYAVLLITVAPLLYLPVCTLLLVILMFVTSPLLDYRAEGPVAIGFSMITSTDQALWYALLGVVLVPIALYLLALTAGAHGSVARALLHSEAGQLLRAELVEVSRSRARLVDAFEAERRRIERDLHDGAQERLVSLTLRLGMARLDIPPESPAFQQVADAHEQAKELMAELRELVRGIHPRVLTDRGLPAALGELADRCPIPITLQTDLPGRLSGHVEATAYFVVAEALTNIAKHSGATSASIAVHRLGGVTTVEVSDNGSGGADPARGSGLTGLADRVAVIDGRMFLSSPVGGPTLLRVELP